VLREIDRAREIERASKGDRASEEDQGSCVEGPTGIGRGGLPLANIGIRQGIR
jgi:hypothetical protein